MTKNSVKQTFLQKVLAFVNGGEEANIANVLRIAAKRWRKQITLKKRAIKDLQEKLVETLEEQEEYRTDELEAYKESFLNVDVEVKGRDNVVNYVNYNYEQQISNAKGALDKREETISGLKVDVGTAVKKLQKEINIYEGFLAEIK